MYTMFYDSITNTLTWKYINANQNKKSCGQRGRPHPNSSSFQMS